MVTVAGRASSGTAAYALVRGASSGFVPRFFAAPVTEFPGAGLVFVSTELGPVLLLGGPADAPSAADRAVKVATALNALVSASRLEAAGLRAARAAAARGRGRGRGEPLPRAHPRGRRRVLAELGDGARRRPARQPGGPGPALGGAAAGLLRPLPLPAASPQDDCRVPARQGADGDLQRGQPPLAGRPRHAHEPGAPDARGHGDEPAPDGARRVGRAGPGRGRGRGPVGRHHRGPRARHPSVRAAAADGGRAPRRHRSPPGAGRSSSRRRSGTSGSTVAACASPSTSRAPRTTSRARSRRTPSPAPSSAPASRRRASPSASSSRHHGPRPHGARAAPRPAGAGPGPARRPRRQPLLDHAGPRARLGRPLGPSRGEARRPLRARARHRRRRAGPRRGRPLPRPRDGARGPQPLRRDPRAHPGDARRGRRDGLRRAGRRLALLHVRLHDAPRHGGLRAGGKARGRPRPAEPDRGRRRRRQRARPRVPLLRRDAPARGAPRDDGGRAGADVPRGALARRRPPGRAHEGLAAPHGVRGHGAALGPPLAEHPDRGHGVRLPRRLPGRGDEPLRGPRHHAPLRARRRPLARRPRPRPRARERAHPGRRVPRRRVHPDLPEARGRPVPRGAGPRPRPRPLPRLPRVPPPDPPRAAAGPRALRLARSPRTSTST